MAAAGSESLSVGFVGAGRMAEAIAQGLIRAGGEARPGWGALLWEEPLSLGGRGTDGSSKGQWGAFALFLDENPTLR